MKVHTFNESDLAIEMGLTIGVPYFERLYIYIYIYICLEGCKRVFWLDACHLKTKTRDQLISAVGKDPNDEYSPFAFAVVEA